MASVNSRAPIDNFRFNRDESMRDKRKELEEKLKQLGESRTRERADVLLQLAWEIGFADLARALRVNQEGEAIAREIGYAHGKAIGNRNLGFYYYAKSDYELALRKLSEALVYFEQTDNKGEQGNVHSIMGLTYWSLGNFNLTLEHLHRSEHLHRETENHERLPWSLTSLGGVYENLKDFDKSLKCHEESLVYFREYDDKLGEARALSGIGTVCRSLSQLDKALEFEKQSLAIFLDIKNQLGVSRAYNDMGLIYHAQGKLTEALDYHKKSLEIRKRLGNKGAEVTSLLDIGKTYSQMQQLDRALACLNEALKIASNVDAKPKLYMAHQALAEAYERKGELQAALVHLRAYQDVRDEVFSDETNIKVKNIQIQYEVEKAEKEAEIHRLRNIELKAALDDLRETQVQLVQSEKMAALGHLTAGIAHEINNPIGAVKSSADLSIRGLERIKQALSKQECADDILADRSFAKTIAILERNSHTTLTAVERISKIVNNLKNFARLDEAEYKKVDIHEGLDSTLSLIQHEMGDRIEVVKDFGSVPPVTVYPNQLNQLFMTLLQNAMQAIEGKGRITIETRADAKQVTIAISDTGKGMSPEVVQSLFDLNFTTKRSRVGVGMGLYNVYNVVKKHEGEIKVDSEPGKGSKFTIVIPIK